MSGSVPKLLILFRSPVPGGDVAALVRSHIGHCRNVRGLGKSMVVFRLFEKLICSLNERSTKFESLYHGQKYLEEGQRNRL